MLGLEMVVILGAAVLFCSALDHRTRLAPPVLLLVCGMLLGFVPVLRRAHLPPDTVLLLFLPARVLPVGERPASRRRRPCCTGRA